MATYTQYIMKMYNVSKAQDTGMIATMLLKLSLSNTTHLNKGISFLDNYVASIAIHDSFYKDPSVNISYIWYEGQIISTKLVK